MESGCHIRQIFSSQSNHSKNTPPVPRSEFPASHTGVSYITSTRGMFALFKRHTSNENDPWLLERLLLPESCGGLPKTVFLQRSRTGHLWKMELRCFGGCPYGCSSLKHSSSWLHSKQTRNVVLSGWCHNLPLTIAWASANTANLERVLIYFQ